ncbi:hypothetical protein ACWGJP_05535 [Microbacterium sp. NPDC055903]
MSVVRDLTEVFVPIGMFGAAIAALCAVIVVIAMAWGRAGAVGMAVGGWIVGAMLSVAASFARDWTPLLVSGAALAVALVVGAIARMLVQSLTRRVTPVG